MKEIKSLLSRQQSFFTQQISKAKAANEASFWVSHVIVKNKKSFRDGEMVKEAFIEAPNSMFRDFKNNILLFWLPGIFDKFILFSSSGNVTFI